MILLIIVSLLTFLSGKSGQRAGPQFQFTQPNGQSSQSSALQNFASPSPPLVVRRDSPQSVLSARDAMSQHPPPVASNFNCPEKTGFFPHAKSCDKYYSCENGTAVLKTCGNGLVFDDSDYMRENCAYPFSVECGERTDMGKLVSVALFYLSVFFLLSNTTTINRLRDGDNK